MSPAARARMLDEATVARCEETSWRDERDYLAPACAGCGLPFWVHAAKGGVNRYCREDCRVRAREQRKWRARRLRAAVAA